MYAIEVNNVTKFYGNTKALDNISFSVYPGEVFGLVGTNGAGKSTFLKILSTILQPSAGQVEVFSHDTQKEDNEVRNKISYLPEESGVYGWMKGKEFLKYMSKIFHNGKYREVLEYGLAIADLGDDINKRIKTYSKGMTRKINIARALMVKANLLILDEFTSGLDVINAHRYRKMVKDYNGTVLISTHNMLEVDMLCDRIALINNGRIYDIAAPKDLENKYNCDNISDVFTEVLKGDSKNGRM